MSDPLTDNNDIEDVLSSIRRLVSQDQPATPSDAPSEAAHGRDEAAAGRLLLTPALRVAEARDGKDSAYAGANSSAAPASGDAAAGEPAPPDAGMAPDVGASRASLEKTIAELEAAVSVYEEEWEPDGSEATTVPSVTSEQAESQPEGPMPLEPSSQVPPRVGPAPSSQAQASQAADLHGSGGAQPRGHPDNVWPFDPGKTAQGRASVDEPPAREPSGAHNHGAPPAAAEFDDPAQDDDYEAVLDEETLRDLVAEIVREELQGELGERITRNVRKLVRSEIARALASRSLEQ